MQYDRPVIGTRKLIVIIHIIAAELKYVKCPKMTLDINFGKNINYQHCNQIYYYTS
jgi:hypothetical protein